MSQGASAKGTEANAGASCLSDVSRSSEELPNILFVSAAFPPKLDSEALQVAKIFDGLKGSGRYRFSVLSTDRYNTPAMPYSFDAPDLSTDCVEYHELSHRENRYLRKISSKIGLLQFPDAKRHFHHAGKRHLASMSARPDVVYSRAFPPSSCILGYHAAEYFSVPWIMHLSDPWYLGPFNKYSLIEERYNRRWEAKCVERATFISVTTEQTADLYCQKYLGIEEKIFLTRNCAYANSEYFQAAGRSDDKLDILYTGVLNEYRDPLPFLKQVRILFDAKPALKARVRISFTGPCDRYAQRILADHGDIVSYLGFVKSDELSELIARADLVLAIDMFVADQTRRVMLLSKLLDYAVQRKKIICLAKPGSPAAEFVAEVNGRVFDQETAEGLAEYISDAADAKAAGRGDFFSGSDLPERFLCSSVVDALITKLDECVKLSRQARP